MDEVYRVWGANPGDGAWTMAASEQEAIEIVAGALGLKIEGLKSAPDRNVAAMIRGIVLDECGKTHSFVRS